MKKILKIGALVVSSAIFIVAVVFAAQTANFGTTALMTFTNNDAFVHIEGEVRAGLISGDKDFDEFTYETAAPYKPKSTVPNWDMGVVTLNSGNYVLKFTLKFTNDGETAVKIEVTPPVIEDAAVSVTLTGAGITSSDGKDTVSSLDAGDDITYTYVIALTDYSKSVNLSDIKFVATMTKITA